jgi:hypothetical protein
MTRWFQQRLGGGRKGTSEPTDGSIKIVQSKKLIEK